MSHFLFLDETGDHGLRFVDENFPLFLLCGCIIERESLEQIGKRVNRLKQKFFGTTQVILHSRDIRKCEGSFQVLFDLQLKEQFYKEVNLIMEQSDYCLLGSAIHKEKLIRKYGKGARDPYSLSFSFIIERLIFYLDALPERSNVEIFAEQRGRKEDQMLLSYFNSIMDRGTYYLNPDRLRQKITGFHFHGKHDNIIGLQLADLCAYPMARHLLHPKESYIPFTIIEKKIYHNKKGKYMGWGLKLFP